MSKAMGVSITREMYSISLAYVASAGIGAELVVTEGVLAPLRVADELGRLLGGARLALGDLGQRAVLLVTGLAGRCRSSSTLSCVVMMSWPGIGELALPALAADAGKRAGRITSR